MTRKDDTLFGEDPPPFDEGSEKGDFLPEGRAVELPSEAEEAQMVRGRTLPPSPIIDPPVNENNRKEKGKKATALSLKRLAETASPEDKAAIEAIVGNDPEIAALIEGTDEQNAKEDVPQAEPAMPPEDARSPEDREYFENLLGDRPAAEVRTGTEAAAPEERAAVKNSVVPSRPPEPFDSTPRVSDGASLQVPGKSEPPKHDPAKTTVGIGAEIADDDNVKELKKSTESRVDDRGMKFSGQKPAESSESPKLVGAMDIVAQLHAGQGNGYEKIAKLAESTVLRGPGAKPRSRGNKYGLPKDGQSKDQTPALSVQADKETPITDQDIISAEILAGEKIPPPIPQEKAAVSGDAVAGEKIPPPIPQQKAAVSGDAGAGKKIPVVNKKRRERISAAIIRLIMFICFCAVFYVLVNLVHKLSSDKPSELSSDIPAVSKTEIPAMANMDMTDGGEAEAEDLFPEFEYEADKNSPIYKYAKGFVRPTKISDCLPDGYELRAEDVTWCCVHLAKNMKRASLKEISDVTECLFQKEERKFDWWLEQKDIADAAKKLAAGTSK